MEYKILTDSKEIGQLVYEFIYILSNNRLQRALNNFSKKRGFSEEFIGFVVRDSIDECDEAYDKMDENQFLLSVEKPAANEDCEAYLTFEEFYNYLETAINRVFKDGHEVYDEPKIRELLKEVKKGLELS